MSQMIDDLTAEQADVADTGPDARLLVTAGPGTGKTYTLVARLVSLISRYGLQPGSEILVLSFSRAAVREIRNRVAAEQGVAAYAFARTFDSFATKLLSEQEPEGAWQAMGYEDRIKAATATLRAGREIPELASVRHVIVDEVQDLVAERAELVKALLESTDVGFTLFGDPAQGIYNFQLAGEDRREGSAALYRWIRWRFRDVGERTLTVNFRARTPEARAALSCGTLLNERVPRFGEVDRRLRSILLAVPTVGTVDDAAGLLRLAARSTAILCRTNGEALLVSEALHQRNVPHRLQQAATDRAVGRWVGEALGGMTARTISKRTIMAELENIALPVPLDPDGAWRLLKRLDRRTRRRSDDLDLGVVAQRIRCGDLPDEITATEPASVIVSTIHRAKGLEFDQVIAVDPADRGQLDETELAEETRTLFVALTRPRDVLMHMQGPDTRQLTNANTPEDRWIKRGWKSWQRLGMEMRGDDAHSEDPAGAFVVGTEPARSQKVLLEKVRAGEPLELKRVTAGLEGEERTFYEIRYDGDCVGVTSRRFGAALFKVLRLNRTWEVRWPVEIHDVFVESVDTVSGTEAAGVRSGLGPSGLWLRVRLTGLGRFEFERNGGRP